MNAALNQRLMHYADAARHAGHGRKEAIYKTACEELRMSRATLLKKLKAFQPAAQRKQRADAGCSALTREEALVISGTWLESRRNNDKRLYSLESVVKALRTNGMIMAGRTDEETGEFFPLSIDAISRALRSYRLHYDQLQNPAPSLELASKHPNHVWQIDASICVLYYLKNPGKKAKGDTGLRVMDRDTFYKNKPKNLDRIVNDRVWSFELIDHTTNWIYVEYRFGGESAENFLSVMINAMQERGGADVLHGVPSILYTDPGSALVSASMLNMCRALGIRCLQHKARNARATGAVEKARDIIECDFEAGLRFCRVETVEELNRYVRLWRMSYNRNHIHSRYGMSRTESWLRITPEQLIKAPPVDICRELAVAAPEERTVTSKLRVSFRGQEFSVESVPGACVGDKLQITRNPWHENEARVIVTDEDGFEQYLPVYAVEKDEWGYAVNAPVIGERYGQMPVTDAQHNRNEVEQRLYGTGNEVETAAARKAGAIPFGGRFNPYKEIEDAQCNSPVYLPRKGSEAQPRVRIHQTEAAPLSHVKAAMALQTKLKAQGGKWNPGWYQYLVDHYPDGIPEHQLDLIMQELLTLSDNVVVSLVAGK
ncbi:DDE-type integrase/transposase/recombinase [Salmonella enterica]|uniref:DDE-type integrase/transposase/recombinase n=1 Tax=Salmonella enterica TaxID=28901 RepID=UPI0009ABCD40|nr:DDE-type integrase/transposase/recombinase [Salmonella enterica]EAA2780377.1 integrase [Salmonella enterica subsp. enterica serovar Montevideo]EDQ1913964.1 transposase family protein [Salmonella enterica subsp. enterica]EDG4308548.1 DDE-type integrase/transposase/recombinase [Salmonella enterica]EDH5347821.1 integrase [Salmonella enterica subsp. enterica serovar Montevideo]EDI8931935.1 integrase [Salmonella enterica]